MGKSSIGAVREATRRGAHADRYSTTVAFLQRVLASGEVAVPHIESRARAAGLLGQRQRVTDQKAFKRAKKKLGIQSIRNGFGPGAVWSWELPTARRTTFEPAVAPAPKPPLGAAYGKLHSRPELHDHAGEHVDRPIAGPLVPAEWVAGIARLNLARAPRDVAVHRWRQLVTDAYAFLTSAENWAARAAALGWDAMSLFGSRSTRPLDHNGNTGLLWNVAGGKLKQLHQHWAMIVTPDGSERTYHRRPAPPNFVLPWTLC